MPVRGEKLLQNLQFINKLIELCSKGRFDMFTEEGDGPYLSSKRCPPRREPSLRKKRAQTRTEEVNHRSPLLEPQPVQLQAWVNGPIQRVGASMHIAELSTWMRRPWLITANNPVYCSKTSASKTLGRLVYLVL